jgi:hypothetical protein
LLDRHLVKGEPNQRVHAKYGPNHVRERDANNQCENLHPADTVVSPGEPVEYPSPVGEGDDAPDEDSKRKQSIDHPCQPVLDARETPEKRVDDDDSNIPPDRWPLPAGITGVLTRVGEQRDWHGCRGECTPYLPEPHRREKRQRRQHRTTQPEKLKGDDGSQRTGAGLVRASGQCQCVAKGPDRRSRNRNPGRCDPVHPLCFDVVRSK